MRLLICFLLVSQFAFSQANVRTKLPGSKYSMVAPEGFVPATNFSGFQHMASGASIMFTEIPGPLSKVSEGFTADKMKTAGMTLLSKETVSLNGSPAMLLKVRQPANGKLYLKQILVFGDESKTVMVNAIYPESEKAAEPGLKNAILSIRYEEAQKNDPLNAVTFKIDVRGTPFTLASYISGGLIFSEDGKVPTAKSSFMVVPSVSAVTVVNRKEFAIKRLNQLPRGALSIVRDAVPVNIDNLPGYEIVANGKGSKGEDELVYQVILFAAQEYFIMVGQARENQQNHEAMFKKIARTFKRK